MSPAVLRSLAADLRYPSASATSSEQAVRTLSRARKIASYLYPSLPQTLSAVRLSLVLQAAAASWENSAIEKWLQFAATQVATGALRTTGVNPQGTPAVLQPGAPSSPAASSRPVEELFVAAEAAQTAWYRELLPASRAVRPNDPGTVLRVWLSTSPRRMTAVLAAIEQLGDAYEFAARGPDSFDCSGLTAYAWGQAGLSLRTSSVAQVQKTEKLRDPKQLRPGDLVFRMGSTSGSPDGLPSGHVGIVAAVVGPVVHLVHASSAGKSVRVLRLKDPAGWQFGRLRLAEERFTPTLPHP